MPAAISAVISLFRWIQETVNIAETSASNPPTRSEQDRLEHVEVGDEPRHVAGELARLDELIQVCEQVEDDQEPTKLKKQIRNVCTNCRSK